MCSKTAVAPLDRIKILLQAHSTHYKHLGVFTGLRHIVRKESLWALYKGNSAQMVRIFPYAATQFTAFEVYKRVSVSPYVHTFLEARTHTHTPLLCECASCLTAINETAKICFVSCFVFDLCAKLRRVHSI